METLAQLIYCNREPRKLKRALAVQMSQQGHSYREIRDVLQVSVGFVTACRQRYKAAGLEELKLNYWEPRGISMPRYGWSRCFSLGRYRSQIDARAANLQGVRRTS